MLSSLAADDSMRGWWSGVLILVSALLGLGRTMLFLVFRRRVQAALGGIVVGVLQAQQVGDQRLGAGGRHDLVTVTGTETGRQFDRLVGRLVAGEQALREEEFVGRHPVRQRRAADLRLGGVEQ